MTNPIPKDWKRIKLGNLFDITSSKRVFQSEWTSKGIPFYRAREIVKLSENGFVDNELFISEDMYFRYKDKYGAPQKDDLLITGVGTVGILYRVEGDKHFYFKDGNIIWLKNKNLVYSAFVEQQFKTGVIKKQIFDGNPITTVATYTIDAAKKTYINFPPLSEQKRIVAILEIWDEALENLNRKIAIKKQIKKGLMQKLLTGKVRLPGFSGEWEAVKLGDVLKIKHGKSQKEVEDSNGKYPILGTGGEMGRTNKFLCDKPSVLIGRKGTIDKPRYMDSPFWTVDTLFYSEIKNTYFPKFLYFYFLIINWREYNEGSGVPSLSASTISNIKITIPNSKEEQIAIAKILTTADDEITALKKKRDILGEQKKYLLNNLIAGKIRTPKNLTI